MLCVFIPFLTYPKSHTNNVPGKDKLCQVSLNIVISHVNMQWHHAIMMAGEMWKAQFLQFKSWHLRIMAYYLLNFLCVKWSCIQMTVSHFCNLIYPCSSLFIIIFSYSMDSSAWYENSDIIYSASFHCKPVQHSFFCKPQKKIIWRTMGPIDFGPIYIYILICAEESQSSSFGFGATRRCENNDMILLILCYEHKQYLKSCSLLRRSAISSLINQI